MKTEIHWLEGPWDGRLAILPRPRGGDWLEDEVRSWRSAGVDVVVSTLRSDENANFNLAREEELSNANGIEFIAFPITDRSVPPSAKAVAELVHRLERRLKEGKNVAVHCRQGIGRSALLAACTLVGAGVNHEEALQRVSIARGCPVPETDEQRDWVAQFTRHLLAFTPGGR